ncbi:hypothetical protein Droror1_Dr00014132 [Drosera rotundifolia]
MIYSSSSLISKKLELDNLIFKIVSYTMSKKGKDQAKASTSRSRNDHDEDNNHDDDRQQEAPLSRYESQKRRDWNTFCQYLNNQKPPVTMAQCKSSHVLDFLKYLDQFGKTKVHIQDCSFYGQPEPPGPCACPLKQAWGSLDALIGRLRAAHEENGGASETNPLASGAIRVYLREVRDSQAQARGVPYKQKKRRKTAAAASDAS